MADPETRFLGLGKPGRREQPAHESLSSPTMLEEVPLTGLSFTATSMARPAPPHSELECSSRRFSSEVRGCCNGGSCGSYEKRSRLLTTNLVLLRSPPVQTELATLGSQSMSRKPPSRRNQWFSKILKRRSRRQARSGQRHNRLTPVESLEARQLLAITPLFAAGQLTITGDGANDTVSISTIEVAGIPQVTVNGQPIDTGVDASAVTSIVANLGGGNDTMNLSSLDFSKFTGLTNNSVKLNGQAGNDTLTGTSLGDILDGGDGNDTLDGGAGDDHLIGGSGNDTLIGGAGDDLIDCGLNNDVVSFSGTGDLGSDTIIQAASGNLDTLVFSNLGGAITIDIGTTALQVVRAGQLSLTLSDANGFDNVQGTAYADTIYGNSGGNSLMGNGGNDEIYGRGGNDTLDGGAGNDTLYGEDGNDTLLGKGGNDSLYGGNGDDTLNGNEGNDYIAGGGGNDRYILANYGLKTIDEAIGTGQDILDVSGLNNVSQINLASTAIQAVSGSLSILFSTPAAIEWLMPAKDASNTTASGPNYQVTGRPGTMANVTFTYGGAFAAYDNVLYVTGIDPTGNPLASDYLFTGNVTAKGTQVTRSYPTGSQLTFVLFQDGGAPIYADPTLNSDGNHVRTISGASGDYQYYWEDLFRDQPNPGDYVFDGDFNDLFMSIAVDNTPQVDLVLDGLPEETSPEPNELYPGAAIMATGRVRLDLIVAPAYLDGTVSLVVATGADKVTLWDSESDGNPVFETQWPAGQQPSTLWVEATGLRGEVQFIAMFQAGGKVAQDQANAHATGLALKTQSFTNYADSSKPGDAEKIQELAQLRNQQADDILSAPFQLVNPATGANIGNPLNATRRMKAALLEYEVIGGEKGWMVTENLTIKTATVTAATLGGNPVPEDALLIFSESFKKEMADQFAIVGQSTGPLGGDWYPEGTINKDNEFNDIIALAMPTFITGFEFVFTQDIFVQPPGEAKVKLATFEYTWKSSADDPGNFTLARRELK